MKLWLKVRRPVGYTLAATILAFGLIFLHALPDLILIALFGY